MHKDKTIVELLGVIIVPVNSLKYKEAETRLPKGLCPIFHRLVEEYEYLTTLKYGRGYVAYDVLADLILAGWRPSAKPYSSSKI